MADWKGFISASMKAGQDLGLYQYCILTDVTANKNMVQFATSSLRWGIGTLQNKPNATGKAAEVAIAGIALVKLGGKATSGSMITANASGFGISMANTEGIPVGRLLYGGSIGDVVPVKLNANGPYGGEDLGTN